MSRRAFPVFEWTIIAAALCAGCLRLWLPAVLPANTTPCTIQGDCFIDGGWMRPDGSYIVTPKCTTFGDGTQTWGPLSDGGFAQCPAPECPWDCVGKGQSSSGSSTVSYEKNDGGR